MIDRTVSEAIVWSQLKETVAMDVSTISITYEYIQPKSTLKESEVINPAKTEPRGVIEVEEQEPERLYWHKEIGY